MPQIVVGVETKIDAPESARQIADYQEALLRRFPKVKKRFLLFLTPDGRTNTSGKRQSQCRVHDISYETVIRTARIILDAERASRQTSLLLSDLSEFLSRDIMKDRRRSEIDKILKELESEEGTAKALDVLRGADQRPTIRTFVHEMLLPSIRETFRDVEIEWHYPQSSARPNEFNFWHRDIAVRVPRRAGFDLYYMLYSKDKEPTKGASISVLLMAHSGKAGEKIGPSALRRIELLRRTLPKSEGKERQWGPWACLWASSERLLGDFTRAEAERLAELYRGAVERTKPRLLKNLAA